MGLTRNIDKTDSDLMSGVYKIYLLPYVKYSRSRITIEDQKLVAFPGSELYEVYSSNTTFTESTEDEGGAVSYSQNFTVEIPKTEIGSQVYRLVKQKYRAIYKDYNGNWRMLGLFNGLKASYNNTTGAEKNSFGGYSVTFTGKEDRQAIYMDGITSGSTPKEVYNFLFQDGNNYNFQNNRNYIFN